MMIPPKTNIRLVHLALIATFIMGVAILSVYMNKTRTPYRNKAIAKDISFSGIFEEVAEVPLQYGYNTVFSFVGLAVDNNQNYILADLLGKQVVIFDKRGKFLRRLAEEGRGPGEVLEPISVAVDSMGNIYVADNATRRLSIFDRLYKFRYSFIISGGHPVPFTTRVGDDAIFMAAINRVAAVSEKEILFKRRSTLLNKYTKTGKLLKTFFDLSRIVKGTTLEGALALCHFDIWRDSIFAVQNFEYKIHVFDLDGALIKTFGHPPKYFKALKRRSIPDVKKWRLLSFEKEGEFLGSFCKPARICVLDGFVILAVEMPRKNYHSSDLSDRWFKIDIYRTDGKFLVSGISTKYSLECTDNEGYIYFAKEINYGGIKTLPRYMIGKYKLRRQSLKQYEISSGER